MQPDDKDAALLPARINATSRSPPARARRGRTSLDLVFARPSQLGNHQADAPRAQGRVVGREQGRAVAAAHRDRPRLADDLPRRPSHGGGAASIASGSRSSRRTSPTCACCAVTSGSSDPRPSTSAWGRGQRHVPVWDHSGLDGDTINMYYGGADSCIALATGSVRRCLRWLDAQGTPPPRISSPPSRRPGDEKRTSERADRAEASAARPQHRGPRGRRIARASSAPWSTRTMPAPRRRADCRCPRRRARRRSSLARSDRRRAACTARSALASLRLRRSTGDAAQDRAGHQDRTAHADGYPAAEHLQRHARRGPADTGARGERPGRPTFTSTSSGTFGLDAHAVAGTTMTLFQGSCRSRGFFATSSWLRGHSASRDPTRGAHRRSVEQHLEAGVARAPRRDEHDDLREAALDDPDALARRWPRARWRWSLMAWPATRCTRPTQRRACLPFRGKAEVQQRPPPGSSFLALGELGARVARTCPDPELDGLVEERLGERLIRGRRALVLSLHAARKSTSARAHGERAPTCDHARFR